MCVNQAYNHHTNYCYLICSHHRTKDNLNYIKTQLLYEKSEKAKCKASMFRQKAIPTYILLDYICFRLVLRSHFDFLKAIICSWFQAKVFPMHTLKARTKEEHLILDKLTTRLIESSCLAPR